MSMRLSACRRLATGCAAALLVTLATVAPARADMMTISGVPAYDWYHGCGPTAAAAIIGYWDLHGYPNLFAASGANVYLTANVQDEISSPAHNAKYDSDPDNSSLADPPRTSIADWFETSVGLPYGGSSLLNAKTTFPDYAEYKGYTFTTAGRRYGAFSWQKLVDEIDAGRPLLFMVDSNSDGEADHFVPVFGYEDRGDAGKWYACYTTWSENEDIVWKRYQSAKVGRDFGVFDITLVYPDPIPEPLTLTLLSLGAIVVLRRGRTCRR